jgi:hypothetical protein
MSFTYNNMLETPLDEVRFRVGDTNPNDPQLQDEEIQILLAESANSPRAAAIKAVLALKARYARHVDKWVGDLKILASQRYKQYAELYEDLSSSSDPALSGIPNAGGVYALEKSAARENRALVQGSFRIGIHDNQ